MGWETALKIFKSNIVFGFSLNQQTTGLGKRSWHYPLRNFLRLIYFSAKIWLKRLKYSNIFFNLLAERYLGQTESYFGYPTVVVSFRHFVFLIKHIKIISVLV